MKSYDTLTEALKDLFLRGYTVDFNLHTGDSKMLTKEFYLHPENYEIKEIHRFEGMSSSDDNSVVYAIESKDEVKGTLVDAYGVYSEAMTPELVEKLRENLTN